jgi:hypothetical protein
MGAAELMQTLSNRSLELSRFLTAYRSLQPRQMAEAPLSPAAIRNDPLDAIGSAGRRFPHGTPGLDSYPRRPGSSPGYADRSHRGPTGSHA